MALIVTIPSYRTALEYMQAGLEYMQAGLEYMQSGLAPGPFRLVDVFRMEGLIMSHLPLRVLMMSYLPLRVLMMSHLPLQALGSSYGLASVTLVAAVSGSTQCHVPHATKHKHVRPGKPTPAACGSPCSTL